MSEARWYLLCALAVAACLVAVDRGVGPVAAPVATLEAAPVQITFTLEDAVATKLVNAIVANNAGTPEAYTGTYNAQPETQNQYAKRKTYEWWKAQVVAAAKKTAETQGDDVTGQ